MKGKQGVIYDPVGEKKRINGGDGHNAGGWVV